MQLLLKNVRICTDSEVTAPQDLRISDGIIRAIGRNLPMESGVKELRFDGEVCVSPGWLDVGTQTCDPGLEHREDLQTVAAAAAAGGFTGLATAPNTLPAVDNKSGIVYIQNKTAGLPVSFYPIGALSVGTDGKDLAELFDMYTAGALAFSDGNHPVQDAGLLLRALQYVRAFDGLILHQPHHQSIAAGGQMHEGVVSTRLGLRGIPALSEEVTIQRDLSLLEYAESRLHLHLISTRKGVEMVRAAKAAGLPVTASVALANLCFTDDKLSTFDSNWKVMPPLRDAQHRDALLEGVLDGTIDFICTNHTPWDTEAKNLEFPFARFGMIGLETAFALCRTYLQDHLSLPQLVRLWAVHPRQVLGLPVPEIKTGAPANFAVFAPDQEWTLSAQDLRSKSYNTPFIGEKLRGKVLGVVHNGKVTL
ncbi:MAG: dihydroorotase [Bacteroidetes bacterium]|nr:MAG: dihydroorotase [Bacteroidota bacterium]